MLLSVNSVSVNFGSVFGSVSVNSSELFNKISERFVNCRSHVDWADQVPIAAAPLNSVPYTGPPLDPSQQIEVDLTLKNQPAMVYLPQPTSAKELNDVLSVAKNGFAASGSAASGIGPLIGSFDIFESDDGFLFRVALPGVVKNERKHLPYTNILIG
ncbi:putative increased DNA methylation [Helianthus annuus]|nr:putative increased DNA methylation [Helianthus annuus]